MSGSYIDTDRQAGVNATVGSVYFGGNRTEQLWVSKRSEQVSECDEIAERGRQDRLAPRPRSAHAPVVTRPLTMLWHFTAPSHPKHFHPSFYGRGNSLTLYHFVWSDISGTGGSEITYSYISENPAAKVVALAFPLRLIPVFLFFFKKVGSFPLSYFAILHRPRGCAKNY